jgi:hypothetical protein
MEMNALIKKMRDPGFFPHDVCDPIRIVQTHISFVILTGPYAYKIKKPVNLGFLDFTTLEKRRHYCDEELRLNRIFTPELYLDVVRIYEKEGNFALHSLGNESNVVEYAVRMRQFEESNLLLNVFDRGELDAPMAERLGKRIAEIHNTAPEVPQNESYGSAKSMEESIQLNFDTILPLAGNVVPAKMLENLHAAMGSFIEKNHWLFDLRIKEERIRECHGDLHLRNICQYNGRIEVFDRIEFNNAFKNIDVMYDLAFLLMDIRYRGKSRIASRILNAYLESTGDYGGAILLPFYQSVRALIRGEVNLLVSADEEVSAHAREEAKDSGLRHLEHAFAFSRTNPGKIIATSGVSGSGKTTVAKFLIDHVDAIHIRSDVIRKHLAGIDLSTHSAEIYSEEHTNTTYAKLIEFGVLLAAHGFTVILDAKFDRRNFRQKLIEKANTFELPVTFVYCTASVDTLKNRLAQRSDDISDATEALTDHQIAEFEPFEPEEKKYIVSIDMENAASLEPLLNEL